MYEYIEEFTQSFKKKKAEKFSKNWKHERWL